jgi:solute carrier family 25 carnitine/acylcarnitine transporter 20/29
VFKKRNSFLQKTWQWEGVKGFYKGVTSPLAGQIFFRSVFFLSNAEYVRYMSDNYTRRLSLYEYAAGGLSNKRAKN